EDFDSAWQTDHRAPPSSSANCCSVKPVTRAPLANTNTRLSPSGAASGFTSTRVIVGFARRRSATDQRCSTESHKPSVRLTRVVPHPGRFIKATTSRLNTSENTTRPFLPAARSVSTRRRSASTCDLSIPRLSAAGGHVSGRGWATAYGLVVVDVDRDGGILNLIEDTTEIINSEPWATRVAGVLFLARDFPNGVPDCAVHFVGGILADEASVLLEHGSHCPNG